MLTILAITLHDRARLWRNTCTHTHTQLTYLYIENTIYIIYAVCVLRRAFTYTHTLTRPFIHPLTLRFLSIIFSLVFLRMCTDLEDIICSRFNVMYTLNRRNCQNKMVWMGTQWLCVLCECVEGPAARTQVNSFAQLQRCTQTHTHKHTVSHTQTLALSRVWYIKKNICARTSVGTNERGTNTHTHKRRAKRCDWWHQTARRNQHTHDDLNGVLDNEWRV